MDPFDIYCAIIETAEKEIKPFIQRRSFYKRLLSHMHLAGPIECLGMDEAFDEAWKEYMEE
ncbi:MAG: hypothetical protein M0R74_13890 [Dehalococcoidia bacterium]|jgi:hypothetical protein|nr:hypothetical protein [Dehalococcoidia bacterium]